MPMSLLRLPSVASTGSREPQWAARIAAIISFTVVLPLLPTIAASGSVNCARQYAASCPSAASGSATATSAPVSSGARSCATSAATAPCASAAGTKS